MPQHDAPQPQDITPPTIKIFCPQTQLRTSYKWNACKGLGFNKVNIKQKQLLVNLMSITQSFAGKQ